MTRDFYRLKLSAPVLSHGVMQPQFVMDAPDDQTVTYLDMLVASDKCLFTLATELDEAKRLMAKEPQAARSRIERIAQTLQELQTGYQLVRRPTA